MLREYRTLRHHDLILAARTDDAAMARLLRLYKGFFAHVLKHCFPRAKRPPLNVYLGEMAIGFMHCVREWDETCEFTTYLYPSLRGMILRQRLGESRLIRPSTEPNNRTELALNSWRWKTVREPRADRHWNRRQHFRPTVSDEEESSPFPDWADHAWLEANTKNFTPRVRDILHRRMAGETLQAIAQIHKVTRERIRMLAVRAIHTLQLRAEIESQRHKFAEAVRDRVNLIQ